MSPGEMDVLVTPLSLEIGLSTDLSITQELVLKNTEMTKFYALVSFPQESSKEYLVLEPGSEEKTTIMTRIKEKTALEIDLSVKIWKEGDSQHKETMFPIRAKRKPKVVADAIKKLSEFNCILCGERGFGKTMLASAVFGDDLEASRVGTRSVTNITKEGVPFVVHDFPEFEMDKKQRDRIRQDIADAIKRRSDRSQQINCIWYCLNYSDRIDPTELNWLKFFSKVISSVPIIAILPKSLDNDQGKTVLQVFLAANLKLAQVVSLKKKSSVVVDGMGTVPSCNLDELMTLTMEKHCLIRRQRAAQKTVDDEAKSQQYRYTSVLGMLTLETEIFEQKTNFNLLTLVISSLEDEMLNSSYHTAGKALRIFSGIAGGVHTEVISSWLISGRFIDALGKAYIAFLSRVFTGHLNPDNTDNAKTIIIDLFKKKLSNPDMDLY